MILADIPGCAKKPWADWQLSGPFDRDLNANDWIVKNYLRIASCSSHRYSSQLTYRYSWPDSFPPPFSFFPFVSPFFSFPLVIPRFLFNYRYHPTFPFGPQVFFPWLYLFLFISSKCCGSIRAREPHREFVGRKEEKKRGNKTLRKVDRGFLKLTFLFLVQVRNLVNGRNFQFRSRPLVVVFISYVYACAPPLASQQQQ